MSVVKRRVDLYTQSPIGHVRADRFERGAQGLRAAGASGMKVGTNTVGEAFTNRVVELIRQDRPEEALRFGRLAVEFWPTSWLPHADLAEAYSALGREEAARRALKPVRRLHPPQYEEMLEYLYLKPTNTDDE